MFGNSPVNSIRVAGVVLSITVRTGKKGQKYAFLSLSDQQGAFEVTLFSEIYAKSIGILKEGELLAIDVMIKKEDEQIRLTANNIYKLDDLQPFTKISLKISKSTIIKGLLDEIKMLPTGNCEVSLEIEEDILGAHTTISVGKKAVNTQVYQQLTAWSGEIMQIMD